MGRIVVVKGGEDTGIDAHKDESAARPYLLSKSVGDGSLGHVVVVWLSSRLDKLAYGRA